MKILSWTTRFIQVVGIRWVLFGALSTGIIASQVGSGTLAYFTYTTGPTTPNQIQAGTLGISINGTSSLTWDSNPPTSAACGVVNGLGTVAKTPLEWFVPNEQCTAPITLANTTALTSNTNPVAAWVRLRFAYEGGTSSIPANLNNLLQLTTAYQTLPTNSAASTDCTNTAVMPSTSNWTTGTSGLIGASGGLNLASAFTPSGFDTLTTSGPPRRDRRVGGGGKGV